MKNKLLIIQYSLAGGGAEKVLCDILNRIDYDRFDVTLLLFQKYGVYLPAVPEKVRIKVFDPAEMTFGWKLLFNRWTAKLVPSGLWTRLKLHKALGLCGKYDCIVSFMEGWSVAVHSNLRSRARRNVTWVHIDMLANHYSSGFLRMKLLKRRPMTGWMKLFSSRSRPVRLSLNFCQGISGKSYIQPD